MKTENSSQDLIKRPGHGRWIGLTLAIVAVLGVSYGALRFWPQSSGVPAVQPGAGVSVLIPVEGMSCSACVARVKRTLKGIEGVSDVKVSLEKREAEIRYQPEKTSPAKLGKAIDELGYKAGVPKWKETPR